MRAYKSGKGTSFSLQSAPVVSLEQTQHCASYMISYAFPAYLQNSSALHRKGFCAHEETKAIERMDHLAKPENIFRSIVEQPLPDGSIASNLSWGSLEPTGCSYHSHFYTLA